MFTKHKVNYRILWNVAHVCREFPCCVLVIQIKALCGNNIGTYKIAKKK